MHFYVYRTTNLINGKKYIGKRGCKCKIEDDEYIGSGTLLKKAISKYGVSNFSKEILIVCNTEAEAFAWEDFYTMQVNAWCNDEYYNLRRGGIGGTSYVHESTKKKLSDALKGVPRSEDTKLKISLSNKGKNYRKNYRHSDLTRRKISIANKGRKISDDKRLNMSVGQKGKIISKSHRENIRNSIIANGSNRGIRNGMYGRIGKDSPTSVKVKLENTGEIFDSIKQASDKYGINNSDICACCKGRKKSAGKLNGCKMIWIYA